MADEIRDDAALLQVTAMLVEASQKDERIAPLASQAIKLVIDSGDALALLFQNYLSATQQPQSYATQLRQTPQQKQKDLLANLEQLLKVSK